MNVYQELTLLPNEAEDISLYFLWGKLYQQLHLAWVEAKDDKGKVSTGVSFPQYDYTQKQLGYKLRIFAPTENEIEALQLSKWLSRLTDYVHVAGIHAIPEIPRGHVVFKRQQTKSSFERIARRKAKYLGISLDESMESLRKIKQVHSHAPFIHMTSQSSKRAFRLMIICEEVDQESVENGFSTFGLSSEESRNSVPVF